MAEETPEPQPLAQPVKEANWPLRIVLLVTVLVVLGLAVVFGLTVLPRWWAHRVGTRVDGSLTAGTLYGLFIGFVFTFIPVLIARQALRRMRVTARLALLALALVTAAPNLMTLSIVFGSGDAAHAGERILDVEAPGFRVGSAWGAVLAVVLALVLFVWTWKWRRDRRQLKALRAEKKASAQVPRQADQQTEPKQPDKE